MLREVREETGLRLTQVRYCGIITFVSDRWQTEYMHLFHATGFTGTLRECDEGQLEWIETLEITDYSLEIDTELKIVCFPTFPGHCGCMLFDRRRIQTVQSSTSEDNRAKP